MKIYIDIITKTEVGSDTYLCCKEEAKAGISDNFLVLKGKMVQINNDEYYDIGGNDEGNIPDDAIQGIDIIHSYNLYDLQPKNKKDAKNIIGGYLKRLLSIKSKNLKEDEIKEWKDRVSKDFLKMYENWDDYSWYVPSSSNNPDYTSLDGIIIFMKWNDDGTGGYLYYHKDSISELSC